MNTELLVTEIANSIIINFGEILKKEDIVPDDVTFEEIYPMDGFKSMLKGYIKLISSREFTSTIVNKNISLIKDIEIEDELSLKVYNVLRSKTKGDIITLYLNEIEKQKENINYKQCADFIKGTVARDIVSNNNFVFKSGETFHEFRTRSQHFVSAVEEYIKVYMFISSGGDIESSAFKIEHVKDMIKLDAFVLENIYFELDELIIEDVVKEFLARES